MIFQKLEKQYKKLEKMLEKKLLDLEQNPF